MPPTTSAPSMKFKSFKNRSICFYILCKCLCSLEDIEIPCLQCSLLFNIYIFEIGNELYEEDCDGTWNFLNLKYILVNTLTRF